MAKLEINDASPAFMRRARLWKKGRSPDEFEPGRVFHHHWGRTLNSGDNSLFSTLTQSYNPLYFNAEYARGQGHPGIVVNPLLVFNTVFGLSVEDLSEAGGPFVGINDCRFLRPVHEGDTLSAHSEVVAKRKSKSKPGAHLVTWRTRGLNQRGETVVEYLRSNLLFAGGGFPE
ncbi:MAG: MaoC family dehydratase [Salinisphaera sp.]|nr:MaoC family dehydratase [Salinisphaera sp.]